MIPVSEQKSFEQRFSIIRTLAPDNMLSKEEQARLTIMDAGVGDVFTCFGSTYIVQEINKYQEASEDYSKLKDYFVTELTCLCLETGAVGHFEWEIDDELAVCITLDQIKFKRLADEEGQPIDEDDLDQIVEDEDTIVYAGETFDYDDDWAAVYRRNGKEEKVYMYEFVNNRSSLFITIEEWQDGDKEEYRIYISKPVNPLELVLISKGGGKT
ncbi:DUF4178 domain-containing protein [Desulfobacter postgatei]|uniref:DUF4178 domain-containing protein n=1 Tax=Desulfobacter postgatei 2ac9 TaxID=879212 RepID=I5AZL4_9BACT|nr:DUF4178 domain-containing protein [Desulfobacter postgatei]EIM62677.1 hypothetical protein DespoDRAFT_00675 [Desulfobacter postgatei 2ac9]